MPRPLILIVDDEPGLLTLFSHLLGQLDIDLLKAGGGKAALDILESKTPDLLILDLAMPEIHGSDVLRYVTQDSRFNNMRIMILSARVSDPEVEGLPFDSWVLKPVLPQRFLAEVRELI